LYDTLNALNIDDIDALKRESARIRQWILAADLPLTLQNDIKQAYTKQDPDQRFSFAVRSSATAEDLPEASFAGQQETFLNVSGFERIIDRVRHVFASLYTERAIAYRVQQGFSHDKVAISAGIQRMIRSDKAASGVIFTLDTESGFDQVIFITAAYGLGETVVQGIINPDEFYVHKPMLRKNKKAVISRKLGSKESKMIYSDDDFVKTIPVDTAERLRFCINDQEVLKLAKQAQIIEDYYNQPMDIEWAKSGIDGELYIVQARPETVKARESKQVIEQYQLKEKSRVITEGRSVGQRVGQGVAHLMMDTRAMDKMQDGEVLVTDMTDPDWESVMKRASAIVTNRGGRTCHAAIVARELGIPAVVGCNDATEKIKSGQSITVSCAGGETGTVYEGLLKYDIQKTEINKMPKLPYQLSMNLANPEQAFHYQALPNDGIGLARLEFIISNMIGIHPNALLHFDEAPKKIRQEIIERSCAYPSPKEFYIEKLTEGIATIAGAFYPKPVIVRFSDFKSNEYANLLGGDLYEPQEENPMLGYRGASRYLSGNFVDCFSLECEAIKRVRNNIGLQNVHIMFPFVRTLEEADQLIKLVKTKGLERGKDALKIYMMCEIPSNAILAEEFLDYFDGYSIGSNDLTQLTLGLDRDSALVADIFDERNAAVKVLLHKIIKTCRQMDKYVGICGQGPSDHPELAQWLIDEGIDSLSLSPDTMVSTWMMLAKMKKVGVKG
jgi:pyruvate,water dikinase